MSPRAHVLARATTLGLAVVASACAGKLDGVVRSQAAFDLSCPEDQVVISDLRSDSSVRDYSASGCGRQVHYQAACSTAGTCTAYRAGEIADDPLPASDALTVGPDDLQPTPTVSQPAAAEAKPEDPTTSAVAAAEVAARAAAAEPVIVDQPPETITETAQGPVEPAKPPPPAIVLGAPHSVTLRNDCPATVTFFIGEKPGESAGRYMRLGSTSMSGPTLRSGEQVWLLDAKQTGLTSVSIADSTREIVVAESCAGLVSR